LRLRHASGDKNGKLEILLYQNRLQLATTDALYSDGDRYKPAIMAADQLHSFLPSVKNVLVLGSGLGSIVHVMQARGYTPAFTLVEYDKVVLRWALEFLEDNKASINAVCADAASFMEQNHTQYDLIFIDIFNDMVVPDFVTSVHFLRLCRNALLQGGRLAFNYIIHDKAAWEAVQNNMATVFPGCKVSTSDVNNVFIGAV
jgi:spermidine synthase